MTYDEGAIRITIEKVEELRVYVKQNESQDIQRRRYLREALRALDVVFHVIRLIDRGWLYHFHQQQRGSKSTEDTNSGANNLQRNLCLPLSVVFSISNDICLLYGGTRI